MKRVLLISMPFAEVGYPSLALGLFKARFDREGIPCDVEYLNILFAERVGLESYSVIGRVTGLLAGEQMFAHVLFGDHVPDDAQYYASWVARISPDLPGRLARLKAQVVPFLRHCLAAIPWQAYDIIGFTSLFEQNLASLALAYHVKRLFPDKIIVFGGANCEEIMGLTLHRCFPCIDYVCSGEADETFPELVKRLSYGHPVHDLPGIVFRARGESVYTGDAPHIGDLDTLPVPDYDAYYARFARSPLRTSINPWVVLETARGCWWGQKGKCTFCSLNGKTIEFRGKSAPRIIEELVQLMQRYRPYQVDYVRVVDNVLNPRHFDDLLPALAEMSLGARLFFEVRPTLKKREVRALAAAGVTDLQAGVESLSTHTLKLMRKGTSALQNIQLLKWSRQYGVLTAWNLISGFPGELAEDYARGLELAQVLTHLSPPTGLGPFRMDRFSYNFEHAAELGLVNVRPSHVYRYVYPFNEATLRDLVYYFDYDYRTPIDDGGLYSRLQDQVETWKRRQDQLYSQPVDGRLVIHDTRPVAVAAELVLEGVRRDIYEYCDRTRSVEGIRRWLGERCRIALGRDQVEALLAEFVAQKLMVREGDLYLSLAVMTYTADFETEDASCDVPEPAASGR